MAKHSSLAMRRHSPLRAVQTILDNPDLPVGQQALVFNLDDLDTSLWCVEVYDAGEQVYLPNVVLGWRAVCGVAGRAVSVGDSVIQVKITPHIIS